MRDPNCVFCKIIAGEITSKKVYEDEAFLAFLDINPANVGHTLIIPKNHHPTIISIPEDDVFGLFKVVKRLAASMRESMNADGLNVLQSNGTIAGQLIPHLHVHLIPRFNGDGIAFGWPKKQASEEEMESVRKKLSEKMGYRG